jgi:hypothetical protein
MGPPLVLSVLRVLVSWLQLCKMLSCDCDKCVTPEGRHWKR